MRFHLNTARTSLSRSRDPSNMSGRQTRRCSVGSLGATNSPIKMSSLPTMSCTGEFAELRTMVRTILRCLQGTQMTVGRMTINWSGAWKTGGTTLLLLPSLHRSPLSAQSLSKLSLSKSDVAREEQSSEQRMSGDKITKTVEDKSSKRKIKVGK